MTTHTSAHHTQTVYVDLHVDQWRI